MAKIIVFVQSLFDPDSVFFANSSGHCFGFIPTFPQRFFLNIFFQRFSHNSCSKTSRIYFWAFFNEFFKKFSFEQLLSVRQYEASFRYYFKDSFRSFFFTYFQWPFSEFSHDVYMFLQDFLRKFLRALVKEFLYSNPFRNCISFFFWDSL